MKKYVMAIDAGTTSNRCLLFDKQGNIVSTAQKEFTQIYPKPGYVEHDANEIWGNILGIFVEAMIKGQCGPSDIASIGITNQRETTVVFDKDTGEPVYNAIVWQCRRTANLCDDLKDKGYQKSIKEKTGLIIDAYFSATKLKWILDNVEGAKEKAKAGKLLFGTIETWIIYKLTNKKLHISDYSNASRTMLFNINTLKWDDEILELLDIPKTMLPKVVSSSEIYGHTSKEIFNYEIPISGSCGDQQAALFGQTCLQVGDAKNTYGTGCFLLLNIGDKPIYSTNGLITTIAWVINGKITYALEGSVFVAGAAIQWLKDEMKLIDDPKESEMYARMEKDTNGCYVIPAFTGLGAPYWDQYARGTIVGLTRGVNKNHIIKATLDSIAYQAHDILEAMQDDSNVKLKTLKVDGKASSNDYLMEMQANLTNVSITRNDSVEATALGAAYLAGLAVGFYPSLESISELNKGNRKFVPMIEDNERNEMLKGWRKAIKSSFNYAKE